jgi:Fibronectin type III domain
LEDAVNLQEAIGNVWSLYDRVFDTAMNLHGEVDVVRSMPVAPNGLTAKAVDATSVRLDWHDKSSFETGFQVYVNNVAASPIRAANTHTKLVTGLKPGTKYCFAIEALSLIGGSGKSAAVCAATPRLPIPDLSIFTGYELGKLYRHPNFPSAIGIDNHDSLAELVWSEIGPSRAVATGQLNYNDCAPGCAQGTYHKYGFEVTASNPKYCTVSVHADYSDVSVPVRAYVYSVITLRALSGTPEQFFVGTSVISTGCR